MFAGASPCAVPLPAGGRVLSAGVLLRCLHRKTGTRIPPDACLHASCAATAGLQRHPPGEVITTSGRDYASRDDAITSAGAAPWLATRSRLSSDPGWPAGSSAHTVLVPAS